MAANGKPASLTYSMYNADNATLMDNFTVVQKSPAVTGIPAASALGDPQLKGFRGQSYQVHGLDGGVYSVISDREVQLNALFTFLDAGRCPPAQVKTQCWSHPGSYFGQVALRTAAGARLLLMSGGAEDGFARVEMDGQVVALTAGVKVVSADGSCYCTRSTPGRCACRRACMSWRWTAATASSTWRG